MNRIYGFEKAPRCTATSKRTGLPCRAPAVRGWRVCRFHGARGGAPKGPLNGQFRHGLYTAEAIHARKQIQKALAAAHQTLKELEPPKR